MTMTEFVPRLPEAPPRYNGGIRCDMDEGPCACGAWHVSGAARQEERE